MDTFGTFGTCRCCLSTSDNTLEMSEIVFDQVDCGNKNISASQSYFDLTGLTEDSVADFSLKICSSCRALLKTSFAFRKTCLESHRILTSDCVKKEEDMGDNEMIVKAEVVETTELKITRPRGRKPKRITKKATNRKSSKVVVLKSNELLSHEEKVSIDFVTAKFVCMSCDLPAKNYAHLIKHRQNHGNYTSRDCKMCGEERCEDFEAHVAVVHPEYRPQQCLTCNTTFINHKDLKQHLQTHMKPERYQCMTCASVFSSQLGLRMHIVGNCSSNSKFEAYRCHVCGLAVEKLANVQQHIFEKHPKDFRKRYYPCFHCKRILVGAKSGAVCKSCSGWFKATEKEMSEQNILPQFQCEKCDRKFYHKEAYECHQIGTHSSRSYCFECDRAFWTISEKRVHQKAEHPVAKIRRHRMCDECGKVFNCNFLLKNHLLTHTSEPQLRCPYLECESAFYTRPMLKRHILCSHKKDYKYECHYCGKRINFYNYIFTHFTRAHFPHLRKYRCDVNTCSRRFASITDKKRHLATHTGEKLAVASSKKEPAEHDLNLIGHHLALGDFMQHLPSNQQ